MTEMNPAKTVASTRILALVAAGYDVIEAMGMVCGADVVATMLSDVYHELRATAQKLTPGSPRRTDEATVRLVSVCEGETTMLEEW